MRGLQGYDVNRGAEYLGQSYMTDSYFKINTDNVAQGYVAWPYEGTTWWESYPIKVSQHVGPSIEVFISVKCQPAGSF